MANLAGGGITVVGIGTNILNPSFYLASSLAITDIGTPVTQDATAANTVKKSGDGDAIDGILQTFEDRTQEGVKTGSVQLFGGFRMRYKTGDAVAVGDFVVSAGAGEVKKTTNASKAKVWAKDTTNQTVDIMLTGINLAAAPV